MCERHQALGDTKLGMGQTSGNIHQSSRSLQLRILIELSISDFDNLLPTQRTSSLFICKPSWKSLFTSHSALASCSGCDAWATNKEANKLARSTIVSLFCYQRNFAEYTQQAAQHTTHPPEYVIDRPDGPKTETGHPSGGDATRHQEAGPSEKDH